LAIPAKIAGCKKKLFCVHQPAKAKINQQLYTCQSFYMTLLKYLKWRIQAIAMTLVQKQFKGIQIWSRNQFVTVAKQYSTQFGTAIVWTN
jgi:histidinol dehydrogenase